jgi:hypothetical protein
VIDDDDDSQDTVGDSDEDCKVLLVVLLVRNRNLHGLYKSVILQNK